MHKFVLREVMRKATLPQGESVNSGGLGCLCERAVDYAKNLTSRVFMVVKTCVLLPFLGVWCSIKEGSFPSQQGRSLFGFSFFGSYFPKSSLADFLSCLWCAFVLAQAFTMVLAHMFFRRNPFKILSAVIGFVVVLVMNNFCAFIGFWNPADSNHPMHKDLADSKIAVWSLLRRIWFSASYDFTAPGDGIKIAVGSINNPVDYEFAHCLLLCDVADGSMITNKYERCKT